MSGIRQQTGTLLAAHALVASFLGATAIRGHGLDAFGWIALGALVLGLGVAAALLGPWSLKFSIGLAISTTSSISVLQRKLATMGSAGSPKQAMATRRYARGTGARCDLCPGSRALSAF